MAKKKKISKPRDWAVVHLICKHNSGVHNTTRPRSFEKRDLIKKIKSGRIEEI